MHSFSVLSVNVAVSDISLKTRLFGVLFVADSMGLSSTGLTPWSLAVFFSFFSGMSVLTLAL